MKRKGITFYTVLISVIFAFCIGFFGYNIIYEYNHGKIRAKKTGDFAISSIERNGNDTDFSRIFENLNDYSAIYIEKDGNVLFSYPNSDARLAEETRFVDVYRKNAETRDGKFYIVLSLYTLRPSVIFHYARFSFIAVLVATIFSIVLIFYYTLTSKEPDEKNEESGIFTENGNRDFSEYGLPETGGNESVQDLNTKNPEDKENIQPENPEAQDAGGDEKARSGNESRCFENPDAGGENKKETDGNIRSYQIPPLPFPENEAENIFSSKTGLGKESQIKTRLDSELIQAASDEQDLSLVALKIQGLDFESPLAKDISALLLEDTSRNLVFEHGSDGFFAIRKDMAIEKAEEEAEILLEKINSLISGTDLKCLIGISSRNTRILSSERLVKEAEEALRHSEEDKERPITAFHIDIEKYREFISQR